MPSSLHISINTTSPSKTKTKPCLLYTSYQYEENIKQLKEVIKLSCANALIKEMEEDIIHFSRYNLPDYMLTSLQVNDKLDQDETNYIGIDEIQNDFTENIFDMYITHLCQVAIHRLHYSLFLK